MGRHEDKLFMKRFSLVIAALVVVTIVIIIIASSQGKNGAYGENPSQLALQKERVQPVAAVRTESPGNAAGGNGSASQKSGAKTQSTGEGKESAQEPMSGEEVFATVCKACHETGAAGAPIPGSDDFAKRAEKGAEALYQSALNGLNAMPAKGGRSDLSDAEVKAAVDYMMKQ